MEPTPVVHPAALDPALLLRECRITFGRRGGPGGQHRNKVETAVVFEHEPTGLRAEAAERRSQEENRRAALFRLREKLALEVRLPVDRDQPASELWQGRLRGEKLAISPRHEDYPALLAEALDRIAAAGWEMAPAAAALGVTTSQLVKLLRHTPRALEEVNRQRAELGLPKLR